MMQDHNPPQNQKYAEVQKQALNPQTPLTSTLEAEEHTRG